MEAPRPAITKEQIKQYLTDPEVLTLEILFALLTLCNVFVMYRLMVVNIPYPVTLTWFQFLVGFLLAWILGEGGRNSTKCSYFPPFYISKDKLLDLFLPTILYIGVVTISNVLLAYSPTVSTYPLILSGAVAFHHVCRFFGCGQMYLPLRWVSVGLICLGFMISLCDVNSIHPKLIPLAFLYAILSSSFRAWALERAMHIVEGRGSMLHNHQVVSGLVILPFVIAATGEYKFWFSMPYDASVLYYWQLWGTLITAGALPFIKNIVANRLIRKTGQAPWRTLELLSILSVFVFGQIFYASQASWVSYIALIAVISGRTIGMVDVIAKPDEGAQQNNAESQEMTREPTRQPTRQPTREPSRAVQGQVTREQSRPGDQPSRGQPSRGQPSRGPSMAPDRGISRAQTRNAEQLHNASPPTNRESTYGAEYSNMQDNNTEEEDMHKDIIEDNNNNVEDIELTETTQVETMKSQQHSLLRPMLYDDYDEISLVW